jgi:outer membrane protein OmpA-like peptidoglycan-associated protein
MFKITSRLLIILLVVTSQNLFAQEKSVKEKRGDEYYSYYSFDKAIENYVQVKDLSIEGQRNLADSYHKIDNNSTAEQTYARFINNSNVSPDDYYNYSFVLRANGKYEEASTWMNKFKELKPDDLRAKNFAEDNSKLTNLLKDQGKYKISHLTVNTEDQDFGPTYYKNKVVFASSRTNGVQAIKREYNWNKKPFLDIYVSEISGDQLKEPTSLDRGINKKLHDGPAAFAREGNFMAFTRNNYNDKSSDDVVKLQIYFSEFKDDKWTEAEPFYLNNPEYSVAHPTLTPDGNTMYFASDMPGGFGAADIYRIKKDTTGKWGTPENLGNKVNTEGNEMFPFYEENNDILLFASNGRLGLGGLDNYACPLIDHVKVGRLYNFGYPVNTQWDDFAVIVNDKGTKGYFTSNRAEGKGDDDIYYFDLLKGLDFGKKIKGVAKDKKGNTLANTYVQLFDENKNLIDTVTTKEDGKFTFIGDEDKTYTLKGTKQGFRGGDTIASTFTKEPIVYADIIMDAEPLKPDPFNLGPDTGPGTDLGKKLKLNPIYFDLNKFNIRPDAAAELDKIVAVMNAYPKMVVELGSHTDCRATKSYNDWLSQQRAVSSARYIKKRIKNSKRIYGKGYGETKLVNECACEPKNDSPCTDEQHQMNRRTEFIIIKME